MPASPHRSFARAAATALGLALAAVAGLAAVPANALELRVLSAGAVEPGMRPALAAFERASGHTVKLTFAAAPELRAALQKAAVADVIVVPQGLLGEGAGAAAAANALRAPIGRVGVGIAVRPGAEVPDVTSPEALKAALAGADSVVFNRASTGAYVETMLRTLGIAEQVDAKATRLADGAAVMRRLLAGTAGRELGFGAVTEIVLFRDQGLKLVGPLPAALQNYTTYIALPWPGTPATDAARAEAVAALVRSLQGTQARSIFENAGIEPAY